MDEVLTYSVEEPGSKLALFEPFAWTRRSKSAFFIGPDWKTTHPE